MKKFVLLICVLFSFALTSCSDIYAQPVIVTNNDIYYEYAYRDNPVIIINDTYYWYVFYNDGYYLRPLPRQYWNYIYRYDAPSRFYPHHHHHHYHGHTYNNGRGGHNHYRRPPMRNDRPYARPPMRNDNRPHFNNVQQYRNRENIMPQRNYRGTERNGSSCGMLISR